jgi:tetratricopeptide (TPR) repeat protein
VTSNTFRGSADQDVSTHPSDETLAAFIDRMLEPGERQGVERHLSECAICRDVVLDAAAFMLEERERPAAPVAPPRPKVLAFPRKLVVGAAVGLAAAAAVILAIWLPSASRQTPNLDGLVAAYSAEPVRLVEGRLSGSFDYAPAPAQRRGSASDADLAPDIRIAVGKIESAAQSDRSVSNTWGLGIAKLSLRDYTGAIAALEESARTAHPATLDSDLAAAYLARGRETGNAEDFTQALAAADRALAAQADLPEALFNRALALQALQRPEARDAWQAVARREGGSPWATEATNRANSIR